MAEIKSFPKPRVNVKVTGMKDGVRETKYITKNPSLGEEANRNWRLSPREVAKKQAIADGNKMMRDIKERDARRMTAVKGAVTRLGRVASPTGAFAMGMGLGPAGLGSDKPRGPLMKGNAMPSGTSTAWGGKAAPKGGPSGPPRSGPSGGPARSMAPKGPGGSLAAAKSTASRGGGGGGMRSGPGSTGGGRVSSSPSKSTSSGGKMGAGSSQSGGAKSTSAKASPASGGKMGASSSQSGGAKSSPAGSKSYGGPR